MVNIVLLEDMPRERAASVCPLGTASIPARIVSAMYAEAFFENDPVKLVEAGLAALPAESEYAKTIADVERNEAAGADLAVEDRAEVRGAYALKPQAWWTRPMSVTTPRRSRMTPAGPSRCRHPSKH